MNGPPDKGTSEMMEAPETQGNHNRVSGRDDLLIPLRFFGGRKRYQSFSSDKYKSRAAEYASIGNSFLANKS